MFGIKFLSKTQYSLHPILIHTSSALSLRALVALATLSHDNPTPSLARHKTTPRNSLASSRVLRSRRRPRLAQRLRHSPLTALIIWALARL